jgi:DNA repair exonuclease SbcCD ATPase subunit
MRDSLDARREALTNLSDLATELLLAAGHNPTPDMLRRIVATVEAISAYALLPNGPTPGRLTHDVDPPSFASLASLMSGPSAVETAEPELIAQSRKSRGAIPVRQQKAATTAQVRRIEEFRKAKIAAAKASLQEAKKMLTDARAKVQRLEAAQKKANAEVKQAEKYKREAESLLEKAVSRYEDAARRAQSVAGESREATEEVEDAKRTVEEATKELESLLVS